MSEAEQFAEKPLKPPSEPKPGAQTAELEHWMRSSVRPQAQAGYSMVTIFLPLGDIAAWQFRNLASVCPKYVNDTVRTTVDQNLLIRWVSNGDLPAFYEDLKSLDLALPG